MPDDCFPPVSAGSARVLILGSFPGDRSLKRQQYYAHPRNAFWKIMAALLDFDGGLCYRDRLAALTARGVALWDVLRTCRRQGSLDSAIEAGSLVPNDFSRFLHDHRRLKAILFNGQMAETVFTRRIVPVIEGDLAHLKLLRLPSTSPAHASLDLARKIEAWSVLKTFL